MMHMDESDRIIRVTVSLNRDVLSRLDRYAAEHRWSRSTAAAELIERTLAAGQDQHQEQGSPVGVD
jgi:metal-responsive CopG/Arc/MetJ family transcriptional regulator